LLGVALARHTQAYAVYLVAAFVISLVCLALTLVKPRRSSVHTQRKMAEASAADGKMKDLNISETKKSKKDGNPKTAAKKPQQQKKKVRRAAQTSSCG
jgi:hypothetical protein